MKRVAGWALALVLAGPAWAQDVEIEATPPVERPLHTVEAQLLVGPGVRVDGGSTMGILSVRGEVPFERWRRAEASIVIPVNLAYDQESAAGLTLERTRFELAPSLRLRANPDGTLQPYGDVGAGLAYHVTEVDLDTEVARELLGLAPFEDEPADEGRLGVMGRLAAGLAIQPDGLGNAAILVEPAAVTFYSNEEEARYTPMVGLGTRF